MRRACAAAVCLPALIFACSDPIEPSIGVRVLGRHGNADGAFVAPRGSALDARGFYYVVDKTGRIQKFGLEGRFLKGWPAPGGKAGRPTALAVDSEGYLWVANTHDHQVNKFSPDGKLLLTFGSEGTEPGRFIYPVGIAIHPDGRVIVGEYGGNDRIQVFDPSGRPLSSWGSYGDAPGCFKRPQGIALDPDGRVYVADAANHRIQVFAMDGTLLRSWGTLGREPGALMYPYGLAFAPDGNLLVVEYGNNRVQKFTPQGAWLQAWGGAGTEAGRLHTPWHISVGPKGDLYVTDPGNHRVQIWPAAWFSSQAY